MIERERYILDVQAYEKQRKYLLRALQCADSRSMVMRAESATRRELIRFQKLVLKLREHCRAVHAAYEAIANKHGETVVVSSFDELLASCHCGVGSELIQNVPRNVRLLLPLFI